MQCEHILKYVHQKICPYCGKDTHEPNLELEHMLLVVAEELQQVLVEPLLGDQVDLPKEKSDF